MSRDYSKKEEEGNNNFKGNKREIFPLVLINSEIIKGSEKTKTRRQQIHHMLHES